MILALTGSEMAATLTDLGEVPQNLMEDLPLPKIKATPQQNSAQGPGV